MVKKKKEREREIKFYTGDSIVNSQGFSINDPEYKNDNQQDK